MWSTPNKEFVACVNAHVYCRADDELFRYKLGESVLQTLRVVDAENLISVADNGFHTAFGYRTGLLICDNQVVLPAKAGLSVKAVALQGDVLVAAINSMQTTGQLHGYDTRSQKQIFLKQYASAIGDVAVSKGKVFVRFVNKGDVRVFDLRDPSVERSFDVESASPFRSMKADATRVFTPSWRNHVEEWDPESVMQPGYSPTTYVNIMSETPMEHLAITEEFVCTISCLQDMKQLNTFSRLSKKHLKTETVGLENMVINDICIVNGCMYLVVTLNPQALKT